MKIITVRTRMALGKKSRCYSYSVYVPIANAPENAPRDYYSNIDGPNGKRIDCLSFVNATQPESITSMALGFDRYDRFKAHEKNANRESWRIIQKVFPETRHLAIDSMPLLWISIPDCDESHSKRWHATT